MTELSAKDPEKDKLYLYWKITLDHNYIRIKLKYMNKVQRI